MQAHLRAAALCIGALAAPVARAQDGTAQPTATKLGLVGVGATVQASFGVFWDDPALFDATATVEAPDGVEVLRVATSRYNDKALTQVEFALDTATARAVDASFVVRCEDKEVRVPLAADVVALPRGGSRVLVAESPFEVFSTDDPAIFDAWRHLVASARLDVDYLLCRRTRPTFDVAALRRVAVVVVGESALSRLDARQVALLRGFVCGGGRLVVFANAFYVGTVATANELCAPFGVRLVDRESPGARQHAADSTGIHKHPLTVGVEGVQVFRPSPAEVVDEACGTVLIDLVAPGRQPFAVLGTTDGGGEVVAIGVSLWWKWCGEHAGNERFLRNLLVRPPRMR